MTVCVYFCFVWVRILEGRTEWQCENSDFICLFLRSYFSVYLLFDLLQCFNTSSGGFVKPNTQIEISLCYHSCALVLAAQVI